MVRIVMGEWMDGLSVEAILTQAVKWQFSAQQRHVPCHTSGFLD